jgi:leader peptidase (prepilin peptidase) / N-methyltransferase
MLAADLPPWFIRGVAFVFGALWGSFFNVAIYRWPREMSVVSPPSHCLACGAPVRPWHNVPIFGYFLLRGKAACCGVKLSPRYPLVELLSALLCLALAERFVVAADPMALAWPRAIEALAYFLFVGGLVIATFVDLEWMEIPDEVSLPGAALGLITVELREAPGAIDAAVGAGMGYLGVQLLFVWAYERVFGRRGMGEGDSKLLMMIGAFLGWQGALFAVVAGSLQGLVAAGASFVTGRTLEPTGSSAESDSEADAGSEADSESGSDSEDTNAESDAEPENDDAPTRLRIPFGPFLALGAIEFLFFGPALVDWYLGLLAG